MMLYYSKFKADDEPFELQLRLKAVSKERPRKGKSGHMFTPKRTRAFEKRIKELAKTVTHEVYTCPVIVHIEIWEPIPKSYKGAKRKAAELGLISPPVGDLDNKVKAITDALNGIAYLDDRQINVHHARRSYGDGHKIWVKVERNGLSDWELESYGDRRDDKGSTGLG